eukprot:COSAG02_NODE_4783_length_4984_cov_29.067086_4_plen_85_part_00
MVHVRVRVRVCVCVWSCVCVCVCVCVCGCVFGGGCRVGSEEGAREGLAHCYCVRSCDYDTMFVAVPERTIPPARAQNVCVGMWG